MENGDTNNTIKMKRQLVWLSSSDMMCKEGFKYYRSACNCQPVLSYLNGIDHFITNLKEAKWSSLFNQLVNTTIFKLTSSTSIILWWFDPRGIFRWLVSNLIRLSDLYNLEYKTVIFYFVMSAVCFSYCKSRLKSWFLWNRETVNPWNSNTQNSLFNHWTSFESHLWFM